MSDADISKYYATFAEESRLSQGPSRLEYERTKELLARHLPPPPARVIDVGGAAGAYSLWLAAQGYTVHLVDASSRLVEEARRRSAASATPIASALDGLARKHGRTFTGDQEIRRRVFKNKLLLIS